MTFDDGGFYRCAAENLVGKVNISFWIDVTGNQNLFMKIYKRRLVSSRCSALYCRAILQTLDGTNTGSKIDEENVLPLLCRRQMDRHSSFLYKEDKPYALSPASSLHRLAGNLTNPHTSRQE